MAQKRVYSRFPGRGVVDCAMAWNAAVVDDETVNSIAIDIARRAKGNALKTHQCALDEVEPPCYLGLRTAMYLDVPFVSQLKIGPSGRDPTGCWSVAIGVKDDQAIIHDPEDAPSESIALDNLVKQIAAMGWPILVRDAPANSYMVKIIE